MGKVLVAQGAWSEPSQGVAYSGPRHPVTLVRDRLEVFRTLEVLHG